MLLNGNALRTTIDYIRPMDAKLRRAPVDL